MGSKLKYENLVICFGFRSEIFRIVFYHSMPQDLSLVMMTYQSVSLLTQS